jgi:hypothetical protein
MIDIIVCFCDRDYHLIDQFLSYIKNLNFEYKLTLIDNRNDKSVDLHEKLANYNYLIPDKDYGLFESRRYGFNHTNNDFVWFVDIDDEIFNFKLNLKPEYDIVIYNFKTNNEPRLRCKQNRIYEIDNSNERMIGFISQFFMNDGVWNKIFNRNTLKKCYETLPRIENFFIYEDLYLIKHFMYFATKYKTDTQYIYNWKATKDYNMKNNLQYAEKFCSLIVNPNLKKIYRKYLDLIYIESDKN